MKKNLLIDIKDLQTKFGRTSVHKGLNLTVEQGEIIGIVGGSGTGKTTFLREMLCLQKPTAGSIKIFDQELTTASAAQLLAVQKRWGVLFQQNALFSGLTVLENTTFPLQEHVGLGKKLSQELALLKILLVGLKADDANKYPAELSGGMQKRAALARALVLDPELLFLDEPTAGLDPDSAAAFDELILTLRDTLGLTILLVTHDLDTLWRVTDRVAFLGDGKVLAAVPIKELINNEQPLIQEYFSGPRGRTTTAIYATNDQLKE
jgi:phospholipid/cholesterol/gamma-HCH transport system ATP-binding protein